MTRHTTGPRGAQRVVVATLLLAAGLTAAGTARADDPGGATGPTGQKLTVSATANIDPAGQKVTVTGSGYDPTKGIYLAVCAVPERGQAPSPCLGGTDMSGTSGSSYWISNNPPSYAKDLVKPFTVKDGKGGFTFDLTLKAKDSSADCTQQACAVVTRADHTHSGDREQDVIVPITFRTGGAPTPEAPPGTVRHDEIRQIEPDSGAPLAIEVDPAAKRLYVSSSDGTRSLLTTYDTTSGTPVGTPVELPGVATTLALDADSKTLHLGLGNRIATYSTTTGTVTDNRTPLRAANISLLSADPGADLLYLGTQDRKVTVYSTTTWKPVGEPVALPAPAGGLAVDTKRGRAYATHIASVPDPATGGRVFSNVLNEIDGTTGKLAGTLELGRTAIGSMGVTVDPGTGTGYVANIAAGTVFAVDLKEKKVTDTLAVGGNPKALAVDSTTGTLYAGQTTAGTVAVVDLRRKKVVQTLETGNTPAALVVDEPGHTLFTLSKGPGTVVQTERRISPTVTTAPKKLSVEPGKRATFTTAGTGTPAPAVGWEFSTDNGDTWRPVVGASGADLSFPATVEHDGNRYRAVLSNPVGSTRSASAGLTVTPPREPGGPGDPDPDPGPGDPDPGDPDPDPDPGDTGSSGGDSGGTGGSGGTVGGGSAGGGTGDTGDTGSTVGGDGSLAATGMSMLPFTIGAAALTALGAAAFLLRRRIRA